MPMNLNRKGLNYIVRLFNLVETERRDKSELDQTVRYRTYTHPKEIPFEQNNVIGIAYLRLKTFQPPILIPSWNPPIPSCMVTSPRMHTTEEART